MKIRQGRKNERTLYVQWGDEASDDDRSIGYIEDPLIARAICEHLDDMMGPRIEAILITGEEDA